MKKVFQKNQIAITALAIMIAVAGYLNFTEQNASKDGNQKSGSSVETIDTMDISDGDSLIKEKAESSQNAAEKNSDEVSEESQTAGSTETIEEQFLHRHRSVSMWQEQEWKESRPIQKQKNHLMRLSIVIL